MACMLQSLPCNVFQTEHELMHSIAFAVDVAAIYMGSGTYARRHFARVAFARRQKPAGQMPVVAEYPPTKCPSMTKARQFLARWILYPLLICPFLFSYRW